MKFTLLGFIFGIIAGGAMAYYDMLHSVVAIKVRPELANLSFWEAFISDHFWDWLWYSGNPWLPGIYVIIGIVIGVIIGLYLDME